MATDDHAIVVGISRYSVFDELRGPENDAAAVVEWLADDVGGAVPRDHIHTVCSGKFPPDEFRPTVDDVYREFDSLIDLAESNDPQPAGRRLYIFMAGHGFGPALRDAALLLANATPRRPGYHISGGGVADHFARAAYFREIVLLMDCCRDDLGAVPIMGLPWQQRAGSGAPARWLYAFATGFSRKAREKPIDGEVRGVFTVAVIEGLRSGRTTSAALEDYVVARMGDLMRDDFQRPYFQPGPEDIEFGPPIAMPMLRISLAPGEGAGVIAVGRGGTAPPLKTRLVQPGETWTLELRAGPLRDRARGRRHFDAREAHGRGA